MLARRVSGVPAVPGVSLSGWRWGIAALALAPFLLLALYPPTAFDATLYHLPFARAFVESGGVPYVLDRRVPVFPQVNEVLFAALMMFGRDLAAHGLQLLMTLATAAFAFLWGRRAWPERPWAGGLAAAVFLGNPIVAYLAGTAYIEAGLTLFVTASLYALDRFFVGEGLVPAREGAGRGWLALSALFAATACDVKYLGLFFLGIAGLIVLLAGGRSRLKHALLFTAVALAFLAPWYLRIYAFNGNPLFPYMPGTFGHSEWNPAGFSEPLLAYEPPLVRWLRLPWDLVFDRRRYHYGAPFSPVYLAAIPLVLFAAWRDRRVRLAVGIVAVYAFIFTFLPPDGRYLDPVLPLASLAVAGSLAVLWAGRPRGAVAALCLVCFLPGWLYAGYKIHKQGPLPITAAQREAYLARELPLYPAIAFLNRTRGRGFTVWALHAENMAYFADGRFLGDWFGPARFESVLRGLRGPEDLHRRLRRLGADHLLVPARHEGLLFPQDGDFRRWFEPVYADPAARVFALR
jgi:4-amino-4-deoxy-L-arabinose transferase-like glycosyltransferase